MKKKPKRKVIKEKPEKEIKRTPVKETAGKTLSGIAGAIKDSVSSAGDSVFCFSKKTAAYMAEGAAKAGTAVGTSVGDLSKRSAGLVAEGAAKAGATIKDAFLRIGPGIRSLNIVKDVGELIGVGEKADIRSKIKELNKKIVTLEYELGCGMSQLDTGEDADNERIRQLVLKINIYKGELDRLQQCLHKLGVRPEVSAYQAQRFDDIKKVLRSMIKKTLEKDIFETMGQKCVFSTAARGLIEKDIEKRTLAVSELGKTGDRNALPLLKEAFLYDDTYLNVEIIRAMINIGDPSAIPFLKEKLSDHNFRIRQECYRGLYLLGGREETRSLIAGIKDGHPEIRRTLAAFLGWLGAKEATPFLIECLKDSSEEVRQSAINALAEIKDSSAVNPLLDLLEGDDDETMEKVKYALSRITGSEISFKTKLKGKRKLKAVEDLREWWNEHKHVGIKEGQTA
ncbi:MAG: HEAT repeat domain-containing protein [Nitrospirota bacterium]|nr:HEAT repeat domain-containing protein [Nitrospirota bacterium]